VAARSTNSTMAAEAQYAIAGTYAHEQNGPRPLVNTDSGSPITASIAAAGGGVRLVGLMTKPAWKPMLCLSLAIMSSAFHQRAGAWAQNWVAIITSTAGLSGGGEDYEVLFEKFGDAGELAWRARLMAGKSALAHLAVEDARNIFSTLSTAPTLRRL